MADASLHVAMQVSRRFSIITGGKGWESMLRDFARSRGVEQCVASIRTVAPTGAALSADPERAVALLRATCRQCVEEDGAEAVIVGGAGLVTFSARLQAESPVPVIDGLQAAMTMAVAVAPLHAACGQQAAIRSATASVECVGISKELAAAIAGQE
jgi:Asp/Glu/hydantoin racemase